MRKKSLRGVPVTSQGTSAATVDTHSDISSPNLAIGDKNVVVNLVYAPQHIWILQVDSAKSPKTKNQNLSEYTEYIISNLEELVKTVDKLRLENITLCFKVERLQLAMEQYFECDGGEYHNDNNL